MLEPKDTGPKFEPRFEFPDTAAQPGVPHLRQAGGMAEEVNGNAAAGDGEAMS
jgi:hypothetical protein